MRRGIKVLNRAVATGTQTPANPIANTRARLVIGVYFDALPYRASYASPYLSRIALMNALYCA